MIANILASLADENPDAPCLRDERIELTRGEVQGRVAAFAGQLVECGVHRGDVVAVMLPNRVEVVIAVLAAWHLGAIVTPVNPNFTGRESEQQLSDANAKVALVLEESADPRPWAAICVEDMVTDAPNRTSSVASGLDDVALLVYTSGSTGSPKGVMLTHANILTMTGAIVDHLELTVADHCLLVLPLFHVNALIISTFAPLRVGGQLSIREKFSARTFFDDIQALRPTYFSAVPTIYTVLVDLPPTVEPDTSSIRFAICGAAPASEALLDSCQARYGFSLIEGYGLTESTCASTINPLRGVRKLGTVGPALPGLTVRVLDAKGSDCPVGQRGEVVIAGPTVMKGYLNRPEATAQAIHDGWLHTGDVGVLDHDGYLTIVDRIKDIIIRGGENIYPKEIERVLLEHPSVAEAAVVSRPHPVLGEVPTAWVSVLAGAEVNAADLLLHCSQRLTRVKVPDEIRFEPSLPKNPVGKIDKPSLRAALIAGNRHSHSGG